MCTTSRLEEREPPELAQPAAPRAPALGRPPRAASGDQPILSIRATVRSADAEHFIAGVLHDIRAYMEEHHVRPVGPPFSICRPRGSRIDVEAGWPTERPLAGAGRIHSGALPRPLAAPQAHPPHPPERIEHEQ